jgi:hypothetical protein
MQQTTSIRIHQLAIVILFALLLWKWGCGGNQPCPDILETVKWDTTHTKIQDSSEWDVMPVPIENAGRIPNELIPKKIFASVQTMPRDPGVANTVMDTAAIVAEFLQTHDYSNSYPFENGTIVVENSVGANKLLKQRVLPTFDVMEISKTITQSEKKRGQVYIGVEGLGNQQTPLFGFGGSLMYKTRKDKIFEAGAVALKDNGIMYKAGIKILLSFRK